METVPRGKGDQRSRSMVGLYKSEIGPVSHYISYRM